ncbi:DnaJ subfamily C member 13 [Intoshia linei]|uniref:DnaJ subfamily C member 13 n=1 Tax=Intoshia linei TaxID=1819745 RepID=A0A177B8X4_9BILA|nr:DnaJ subfamily C member 13 [Intoshia linei]
MSFKSNLYSSSFLLIKHSWKGRYSRIVNISEEGLTSYQPTTFETTNIWPFSEIAGVEISKTTNEFNLIIKKARKTESLKFASEYRDEFLALLLTHSGQFCSDVEKTELRYSASKFGWKERYHHVILTIDRATVYQTHSVKNQILASYHYYTINEICFINNSLEAFALVENKFGRMHLFSSPKRKEIINHIVGRAAQLGQKIKVNREITVDFFLDNKFGIYSDDNSMTSLIEFNVEKIGLNCRRTILGPIERILCLAEKTLIERDKNTYSAITVKPLIEIYAIIQHIENSQMITLEYIYGQRRSYYTTERDELICSLLDGVRGAGNKNVCVKTELTHSLYRMCPMYSQIDDEMECNLLKGFMAMDENFNFFRFLQRFNANIAYSGLNCTVVEEKWFGVNKDKLINKALEVLIEYSTTNCPSADLELIFQAMRRLIASKSGYTAFTDLPKMRSSVGGSIMYAMSVDKCVLHSAIEMMNALMQPMHDNYELYQEQLNKVSITSNVKFVTLIVDKLVESVENNHCLIILSILDFVTYIICFPYSETTEQVTFDLVIELLAKEARILFKLFQSASPAIVKGAGLILKAMVEEGSNLVAQNIQRLSLSEGALIRHVYNAFFLVTNDGRRLALRQISRYLLSVWYAGSKEALNLFKRILPAGLLQYLTSSERPSFEDIDRIGTRQNKGKEMVSKGPKFYEELDKKVSAYLLHWRERVGLPYITKNTRANDPRVAKLRIRKTIKNIKENWEMLFYQFSNDHSKPNLIWNYKTRDEMRRSIEEELSLFNVSLSLSNNVNIAWNHQEFMVNYPSLADEVMINDYYLRLILDSNTASDFTDTGKSIQFFNDLYHRFLITSNSEMKSLCLKSMVVVYQKCHETIGKFNDTKFIVLMLQKCTNAKERDELIIFMETLILNNENAQEIIKAKGISILIDILPLAHLHVNRAVLPTTIQAITSCAKEDSEGFKDWYYSDENKKIHGPYSIKEIKEIYLDGEIDKKTICWAQGLDGWKPLLSIAFLKWTVVCDHIGNLTYSELAEHILNILIGICNFYPNRNFDNSIIRPMAKIRMILSHNLILPHIIQLILTFDPTIIEKLAVLLLLLMQDNPHLSRLYLTGVFFFLLMYTGSNLLPISNFLKYTHTKQSFRFHSGESSFIRKSILSPMLPEAMIWCMENYDSQEFSKIFIGEFNTPEFIWNTEMRRLLIMKISQHMGEFIPRIVANTHILYQYLPMNRIEYPQLEGEVFCNIYYLRHLTNEKFRDTWDIKDPVALLKDVLSRWNIELNKKSPKLSIAIALKTLAFNENIIDLPEINEIKRQYYALSTKYHPDKNPEGEEMFIKINEAYEFLSERKLNSSQMTVRKIMKLILGTQIILYKRYPNVLKPFKYAGYNMLVKMLNNEASDDDLFSKEVDLLPDACELVYYTVKCSRLNAQELKREGGIRVLKTALTRSTSMLSLMTKSEALAVDICHNIAECFTIASTFEEIREVIQELPSIITDFMKIVYFRQLVCLNTAVIQCLSVLCRDIALQMNLFKHGALFYVIENIFKYDYTLKELDMEHEKDTNKQLILNVRAKESLIFCAAIAGYLTTPNQTPVNRPGQIVLNGLFTPYVSRKMVDNNFDELLKLLNMNAVTPYIIWDNTVRNQLIAYAREESQNLQETGKCKSEYAVEFKPSAHKDELVVGEIFINIYNSKDNFPIESPKAFVLDIMAYLTCSLKDIVTGTKIEKTKNPKKQTDRNKNKILDVHNVLKALYNVMNHNPGVEMQLVGHIKTLLTLINVDGMFRSIDIIIDIFLIIIGNQICISDIAQINSMESIMFILQNEQLTESAIIILNTLLSSKAILRECLNKGVLIYMLEIFCNSELIEIRVSIAALMAKCLSDKLFGPKLRIILSHFLPMVFMDAMCDSPSTAVQMFDGIHENPELIWTKSSRESIQETVENMKHEFFKKQKLDPKTRWRLPSSKKPFYNLADGEIIVSSVYLRIYILNPGWVLRNPRQFITELLNTWCTLSERESFNTDVYEMVAQGITAFMTQQMAILDQIPSMGHIPRILNYISNSSNPLVSRSGLLIVNSLSRNAKCVEELISKDCLKKIIATCKKNEDIIDVSVDIFRSLFESNNEQIAKEVLDIDVIPYLLEILSKNSVQMKIPNFGAIKANLVKALKSLAASYQYGTEINEILNSSRVWKEYCEQLHDLFLNDSNRAQLEGPQIAGYIMSSHNFNKEPHL